MGGQYHETHSTAAPSPAPTVRDFQPQSGFNAAAPVFQPGVPLAAQAPYVQTGPPSQQAASSIAPSHLAPPASALGSSSSGTGTDFARSMVTPATSAGESTAPNLADKLEALQLTSFYVRPGYGEKGRKIMVQSNYFAVRAIGGRGKKI